MSLEEHLDYILTVLSLLSRSGVWLKLNKWCFLKACSDFLGHVMPPGRLAILTKATGAIQRLQHPMNVTDLKSFLGLCNEFCRFVPNFASITAPLNSTLEKDQPLHFKVLNETGIEALETLQQLLFSPPILSLLRPNARYMFDTDACDKKIVWVLLQENPKEPRKPEIYCSSSLNSA